MQVSDEVRNSGAAAFGVEPGSFKELGGTDGAVYACRQGSHAFVIKFVPLAEDAANLAGANLAVANSVIAKFNEKLRFMRYLCDHGVSIAMPVESTEGNTSEQVTEGDQRYLVTVSPLASGQHPIPRNLYLWNERLFQSWGQVIGRMHALARQYPYWEKPPQGLPPSLLEDWREEHRFFVEWCKEPKIIARWMPFVDFFQGLPRDRSCYGLIHNDLHPMNFLYNPDARGAHPITIIDFDVCGYHWFIMDIAIALYHAITHQSLKGMAERRAFARHFLSHFMSGYRQENELDETWLTYLPEFTKYREILVYIALSNSWPAEKRNPWQRSFLAEKRGRTLREESVL
jgi:Ser/Thr protein kinase RdoA (MazF antagonist)